MKRDWPAIFPELVAPGQVAMEAEVAALLDAAAEVRVPARATIFHQGDQCSNYLLVIEGSVKVMTRAENGREIVLYRLSPGDSCVLTTSCLFGNSRYPAEGVTATAVLALAIPADRFHQAVQTSVAFRRFVFATFSGHLGSLITLVEEVAFGRVDVRLARHLLDHADATAALQATHQELATELGTAREVISRQLKDFEQRQLVRLQRGSITLLDTERLGSLASD
ncbi:MAG: Crp/Fnr family transcriptional regulator [Pseudomonadota bacterium]